MYEKIVVPLDGSKLAECVLPYVEELARGCGAEEVILVSVTELLAGITRKVAYIHSVDIMPPPEPVHNLPVTVGKKQRQAERYLNRIAKRLSGKRVRTQTAVLLGDPAEEIVRYAKENHCGLIAMASHGRSGLSRWAFGSVTDRVLRASSVPVLIVRAPGAVPSI